MLRFTVDEQRLMYLLSAHRLRLSTQGQKCYTSKTLNDCLHIDLTHAHTQWSRSTLETSSSVRWMLWNLLGRDSHSGNSHSVWEAIKDGSAYITPVIAQHRYWLCVCVIAVHYPNRIWLRLSIFPKTIRNHPRYITIPQEMSSDH